MKVKYPEIEVALTGEDGNGFFIVGRVYHAMRKAGLSRSEIDAFLKKATSGDYDHLLRTVMQTVTVT